MVYKKIFLTENISNVSYECHIDGIKPTLYIQLFFISAVTNSVESNLMRQLGISHGSIPSLFCLLGSKQKSVCLCTHRYFHTDAKKIWSRATYLTPTKQILVSLTM